MGGGGEGALPYEARVKVAQPYGRFGFNELHRPHQMGFDTLVLKKTCTLMACVVPPIRSSPSLGRSCIIIEPISSFDPQMPGF